MRSAMSLWERVWKVWSFYFGAKRKVAKNRSLIEKLYGPKEME